VQSLSIDAQLAEDTTMAQIRIAIPTDAIAQFCRRWQIRELALFGSVLRDEEARQRCRRARDLRRRGDVGVLDHVQMQQKLAALLRHPVDLINRRAIEQSPNASRRVAIPSTAPVIYRAE
jgi:predicted nucleotidyltransferase